MANLIINGGKKVSGEVTPSGNKNSILPILCASLLTKEDVILHNVPDLTDVNKLVELLKSIGSKIQWDKPSQTLTINNAQIDSTIFEKDMPVGMRGTILIFAPLLYRIKKLNIQNEIGGCTLGVREIDPHLDAFEALGAKVVRAKRLELSVDDRFEGGEFWPDYMSVTATENFVMGAALAKGKSKIVNAASEPHVQDVCNFLNQMGAKVSHIGMSTLEIEGVTELHGTEFTISSDYHEICTFLAIGAMTGGEIRVKNAMPQNFPLINRAFKKLGVEIEYEGDTAIVRENQKLVIEQPYTQNMLPKIEIAPWPYFPVDVAPLMIALAVKAKGQIMVWNKMYEAGMFWIQEMSRFGAHIVMCDPHRIIIFGGKELTAATVYAPNIIRATIGLAMVGLSVPGQTIVKDADTVKRAHPDFVEHLQKLGADIKWQV